MSRIGPPLPDRPSVPRTAERHFWFPIPNVGGAGVRHAFRGRRWSGEPMAKAVCGAEVALAQASEVDWICFPTCEHCYVFLKERSAASSSG